VKFNPMPVFSESFKARFFGSLTTSESGCLEWSKKIQNGYGRVRFLSTEYAAHRVAWWLANGEIPDQMVIDHLCRNRRCANVDHLEVVSQAENVQRGDLGRMLRQTHCPQGHEMTESNKSTQPGKRRCRTCYNESMKVYMRSYRSAS
jgi:hypothetical protein